MKTMSHPWWIGLLALAALLLLGTAPLQAALPAPGSRWVPFAEGAAPATPELTLLAASADQIDLAASLPGAWAEDLTAAGSTWTRLSGDGYGHRAEIGQPDLPVLRRDVEIPFGASVTVEILAASYRDTALSGLGLQAIYPLQPPLVKAEGAADRRLTIDRGAYEGSGAAALPVRLGEVYVVRGHRVQTVEVWPVAYDPRAGTARLYSQVAFRLVLQGSDMARTSALATRYATPALDKSLAGRILNFRQGQEAVASATGYLIITADAYSNAIQPLADLRASRGLDVTVTRCSEIAGGCLDTGAVKTYIQAAYDTWPVPPSYVLLVGDTDTVATWTGPTIGTSTDLYYGTMDGSSDWHPDIGRGRFPVRSAAQTTYMVDKYLAYATLTGQEPWVKKASFPATCDNYPVAEGTHNYVIDSYTLPGGYSGIFPSPGQPGGDKLYCVTHGATHADLIEAFNDQRWVIIYSGHGSYGGWEMDFTPTDIRNLTNDGSFPFVASHACLSGDYGETEVFGETWVLQQNKGALMYWGSSTYSYWGEDDILERGMFDELFAPRTPHADAWTMTDAGLAAVEAAYAGSARYYWETYNILGDPAARIFIEPDLPSFTLNVEPDEHEVCQSGTVTSSVTVGSLQGYSETVYLQASPMPPSVTVTLEPPSAQAPFTATLTLQVAEGAPAGEFAVALTATDQVSWTVRGAATVRVRPAAPAAPILLTPADGAIDVQFQPTLTWDPVPHAATYGVQLDESPLFAAPLWDVNGLAQASYALPAPLAGQRCYWWRAQGANACGSGDWAEPYHFAAVALGMAFFDDVESGNAGWSVQLPWAISDEDSHSPSHAWTDSPGASYLDNVNLAITSPVLDLSAHDSVAVGFWHTYETESGYDFCYVEYSVNGGSTWTVLQQYDGTGAWAYEELDVPALAHQANVRLRFRLQTDYSVTADGWHVDDIQVIVPLPPNPAPLLTDVVPDSGAALEPTPVQIAGSGFVDTPVVRLGSTWLLSVTLVSSTTLDAVVPAGMPGGTYDLTLYNGDCQEATLVHAFTVTTECMAPVVSVVSDSPVELGEPVHLTSTVSGTGPFAFAWDFGDGLEGSADPNPVYTYTAAGDFTATLAVTGSCGTAGAWTVVSVVVPCQAPAVEVASDGPVVLGKAMHLTSTVSGTGAFTYSWDFGDGVGASSEPNPTYTYGAAGTYTVTLTVEGACGSDTAALVVTVLPPVAQWTVYLPLVSKGLLEP